MDQLTTSEVAKRGGVNLETIRYYERRGLLPKPPRTVSGYRIFAPEALRRLRFVKRAQAIGFSLQEIKTLLSLRAAPKGRCAEVRQCPAGDAESTGAPDGGLRGARVGQSLSHP